mmetsp:Transcript_22175/g.57847  ORF Transcript_22175/g.57847 Transcript_22175/m.57847 type:complete len:388 (+) Transcript_22175:708-1871(+)
MSQDGEVTREEGCHTSMAHSSPLLGVLVLQEDPRTGILRLSPQSSQFSLGMAYSNSMSSSSSVKQRHMQRSRSSFNAPFQPELRSVPLPKCQQRHSRLRRNTSFTSPDMVNGAGLLQAPGGNNNNNVATDDEDLGASPPGALNIMAAALGWSLGHMSNGGLQGDAFAHTPAIFRAYSEEQPELRPQSREHLSPAFQKHACKGRGVPTHSSAWRMGDFATFKAGYQPHTREPCFDTCASLDRQGTPKLSGPSLGPDLGHCMPNISRSSDHAAHNSTPPLASVRAHSNNTFGSSLASPTLLPPPNPQHSALYSAPRSGCTVRFQKPPQTGKPGQRHTDEAPPPSPSHPQATPAKTAAAAAAAAPPVVAVTFADIMQLQQMGTPAQREGC